MEHLLKAAGNQTGQHAAQARVKAEDSLRAAKARVAELQDVAAAKTRAAGRATDEYVRANPWQVLADLHLRGIRTGLDAFAEPGIGFLALGALRIPTRDAPVLSPHRSAPFVRWRTYELAASQGARRRAPVHSNCKWSLQRTSDDREFRMPERGSYGPHPPERLAPARMSDAKAVPPSPRENRLLAALPPADYDRLLPCLEPLPLPLGWIIGCSDCCCATPRRCSCKPGRSRCAIDAIRWSSGSAAGSCPVSIDCHRASSR